ncbi:MAG: serpin family protein [Thiomargarita sp.]|nr:serpin family protein [Thiomargarita sp.]
MITHLLKKTHLINLTLLTSLMGACVATSDSLKETESIKVMKAPIVQNQIEKAGGNFMPIMSKDQNNSAPPIKIETTVSDSINNFALDIYTQLHEAEQANLFFSPYSISSAFAMVYAGAKGETKKQMATALNFNENQNIHLGFSDLEKNLTSQNNYQLNIANALWGQKGFSFLVEFVDLVGQYYGAKLKSVNFKKSPEQARQTINQWVSNNTSQKIKELLVEGVLTQQTKLVLTNAIYFKSSWQNPFDSYHTKQLPFKMIANKQINVPTMQKEGNFKYAETDDVQILELPYQKKESETGISMFILLPKTVEGLSSAKKEKIQTWITLNPKSLEKKLVKVHLPKFKLESSFSLKESLKKLGMLDAFNQKNADFSGLNGKKDLVISDAVHKTFINVDENGTEATAATSIIISAKSIPVDSPIEFRVDHPFLFLIKDIPSNTILFWGKVSNPLLNN